MNLKLYTARVSRAVARFDYAQRVKRKGVRDLHSLDDRKGRQIMTTPDKFTYQSRPLFPTATHNRSNADVGNRHD